MFFVPTTLLSGLSQLAVLFYQAFSRSLLDVSLESEMRNPFLIAAEVTRQWPCCHLRHSIEHLWVTTVTTTVRWSEPWEYADWVATSMNIHLRLLEWLFHSIQAYTSKEIAGQAVVLQVTGPFGAPAQKVWGFETLMVVGAGIGATCLKICCESSLQDRRWSAPSSYRIVSLELAIQKSPNISKILHRVYAMATQSWQLDQGSELEITCGCQVTPFASILRSVQLRAKQRESLLKRKGSGPGLVSSTALLPWNQGCQEFYEVGRFSLGVYELIPTR